MATPSSPAVRAAILIQEAIKAARHQTGFVDVIPGTDAIGAIIDQCMSEGVVGTQWWVADLDQYGNPSLTDGAHSKREGCEQALYIMKRLGLGPDQKRAICRVQIYPPEIKAHDANEEALSTLNSIGLREKTG